MGSAVMYSTLQERDRERLLVREEFLCAQEELNRLAIEEDITHCDICNRITVLVEAGQRAEQAQAEQYFSSYSQDFLTWLDWMLDKVRQSAQVLAELELTHLPGAGGAPSTRTTTTSCTLTMLP